MRELSWLSPNIEHTGSVARCKIMNAVPRVILSSFAAQVNWDPSPERLFSADSELKKPSNFRT